MLGQCMCSAAEYLMALATSQKQTLWNKGEMKNGDIQHLIVEQSGGFCSQWRAYWGQQGFFFLPELKIPLQISDCRKTSVKSSQKFLESKILSDHNDGELSLPLC